MTEVEMKTIRCKIRPLVLFCCTIFAVFVSSAENSTWNVDRRHGMGSVTPMHKVLLTQRGYIQFLRWELPVPEIKEFTFCLWVTSNNLTHPHSIFSYSKNENERLIRSWISSHGRSVHLEIEGMEVFNRQADITENRWYHICQSWESNSGRYALWINDRIEVHGQAQRTRKHVIKSGGDIVLGQEYTDFDKGLEEGVEGAVLGFNFLLSSAFSALDDPSDVIAQSSAAHLPRIPYVPRNPSKTVKFLPVMSLPPESIEASGPRGMIRFRRRNSRRMRRSTRNVGTTRFFGKISNDEAIFRKIPRRGSKVSLDIDDFDMAQGTSRLRNEPLGLQLVKLSYVRCEIGRGSPFIGGPLMLISWSRTPVRIFGGATVKNVPSDCGHF